MRREEGGVRRRLCSYAQIVAVGPGCGPYVSPLRTDVLVSASRGRDATSHTVHVRARAAAVEVKGKGAMRTYLYT